jgi:hypothetical protein
LEQKHLTSARWHTLAKAFLDEERIVRERVMDELVLMLSGRGKYDAGEGRVAPSLRFLALVTLCVDGDHKADHTLGHRNAANVGKKSNHMKLDAMTCIKQLRTLYNLSKIQYDTMGTEARSQFQTKIKPRIMPEYAVPYAFHLLALRPETPAAGGASYSKSTGLTQTTDDGKHTAKDIEFDEGQHRVLRKRLKMVFDPLIESLGDDADNISFLMRMTELLSKHFDPIFTSSPPLQPQERSDDNEGTVAGSVAAVDEEDRSMATARRPTRISMIILEISLCPICILRSMLSTRSARTGRNRRSLEIRRDDANLVEVQILPHLNQVMDSTRERKVTSKVE